MGIKITSLPVVSLPYSGSEQFALVQSGTTKVGNLSSLTGYLSGALLADSELAALSGNWQSTSTTVRSNSANWQNTYTTYRANSANYAVKNAINTFTPVQSFSNGIDFNNLTRIYTINANNLVAGYEAGNNAGSDGGTLVSSIIIGRDSGSGFAEAGNGSYSVVIGYNGGYEAGKTGGDVSNSILIGRNAGFNIAQNNGYGNDVVVIGQDAGRYTGVNQGDVSNSIFIGKNSGQYMGGGLGGTAFDAVVIGNNAGKDAAFVNVLTAASASSVILIGNGAGQGAAVDGNASDSIILGTGAGNQAGCQGVATNNVIIGGLAGFQTGNTGSSTSCIMIGAAAGYQTGMTGGSSANTIMIGTGAGQSSGVSSNVNDSIYIGRSSGQSQTASFNIFIGTASNTATPSNASLSGCIAIGHGAAPSARNTIALGSSVVPLSVVPGRSITSSLSGLKVMINGVYYTIPLLA